LTGVFPGARRGRGRGEGEEEEGGVRYRESFQGSLGVEKGWNGMEWS